MIKTTAREIDLRTENETTFVTLHYGDGSTLDLKGPRSGLKVEESYEDGVVVYKCEFSGFELV